MPGPCQRLGAGAFPRAWSGPADTPEGIMRGVVRRLGLPTVRAAMRKAMRVMGSHFVLGQSITRTH